MNNIVPYRMELPAVTDEPSRYQEEGSSLRNMVGIVLARAKLAGIVGVALAVLVAGTGLLIPRSYYAEGSLLIQPRRTNLAQAEQVQNALPPDTSAVDTEVELLRSRAIAESVVRSLKLTTDPEFNPAAHQAKAGFVETTYDRISAQFGNSGNSDVSRPGTVLYDKLALSPPSPDEQAIAKVTTAVQRKSSIRRVGLTYVVHIGFTSSSAAKAEKIANAFIDAYVAQQMVAKIDAVASANDEIDQSVGKLRKDALDAEARVQEYKNANNLLSIEGVTMAESELSALNKQIADAKADHAEKEARVNTASTQLQHGSGGGNFLGSDTITELRKTEAQARVQLAQLTTRFKADYPEVMRAQAELNDVERQIQAETNRTLARLRYEADAAAQREASLLESRNRSQSDLTSNNRARVGLVALQQRADAAKKIYENYLNRSSELAVEKSLQQADATVNYKAAASTAPTPSKRMIAALAAFAGLLGAVCSVLLSELWVQRVRSRVDVERGVGVPLAGIVPDFHSVTRLGRGQPRLEPADHLIEYPYTAFAEAFRNLRAYLTLTATDSGQSKVIAVASAVPGEGKSMTSLCLARTLAQTGSNVVLVDCDLRRRGVTKMVGDSNVGIREVIENNTPLERAMVRDEKSKAWILRAAGSRTVPQYLFGGTKFEELLRSLTEKFEYVILDTPPILGMADARMLVSKADGVLYVVQWNKTPAATARAAVNVLNECGARIAGTLLTQVNITQQAQYGYGDGSDYFHYYRNNYLVQS